jgi:hypothetical protein
LRLVAGEGELDELFDEGVERHAAMLPHFRVHADGGKAGDGVDLVEVETAGGGLHEKVDAAHAFAVAGAIGGDGEALEFGGGDGVECGGEFGFGRVEQVLVFVVVELAGGEDFAGDRGAGVFVVAEDGAFEFAADDGAFDENFPIVVGGEFEGGDEFGVVVRLRDADWSCRGWRV